MERKKQPGIPFLTDILSLLRRPDCGHTGETGEFCGKCGADIRVITSYECRLCGLLARPKVYPADLVPDFCTKCGAPKFTFSIIRKKPSRKKPEEKKRTQDKH